METFLLFEIFFLLVLGIGITIVGIHFIVILLRDAIYLEPPVRRFNKIPFQMATQGVLEGIKALDIGTKEVIRLGFHQMGCPPHMRTAAKRLTRIIYHEAAHVVQYLVMCKRLGLNPRFSVTFATNKTDDFIARTTALSLDLTNLKMSLIHRWKFIRDYAWAVGLEQIKISLAGYAMEYLLDNTTQSPLDFLCDLEFDPTTKDDLALSVPYAEALTGLPFTPENVESYFFLRICFDEAIEDIQRYQGLIHSVAIRIIQQRGLEYMM